MARKKVKLAWIVNNSARKTSLKKRRLGLLKKVSELATLCDVSTFVIIYSPDDNEPTTWPSRPIIEELVARFQSLPEMKRTKKMMSQDSYLKERVAKEHQQHKKLNIKNQEVEAGHLIFDIYKGKTLDRFHVSQLQGLELFVAEKMKEIRKRIIYFQHIPFPQESLPPQGPMPRNNMGIIESSGGDENITPNPLIDPWIIDLLNYSPNLDDSSNVRRDVGLPHSDTYVGSSSIPKDVGLLPPGTFGGHTSESGMGLLPHGNTRGSNSGNIMRLGQGMQPQGNIRDDSSADDNGLGQQPQKIGGVSTSRSEIGLPFRIFGGNNEGSDVGLPFDVSKTNWQKTFTH